MAPKGTKPLQLGAVVDAARASQLCDDIEREGRLPSDEVLSLLRLDGPTCSPPCKANRKDHPGCFCCLAPAVGSFRKKGLWQKDAGLLGSLGQDPALLERKVSGQVGPCRSHAEARADPGNC